MLCFKYYIYIHIGCLGFPLRHAGFPLLSVSGGLLSSCGVQASHCLGFPSCGLRALGHELKDRVWDFPGRPVVKALSSDAEDAGSIPGWGGEIFRLCGQESKT